MIDLLRRASRPTDPGALASALLALAAVAVAVAGVLHGRLYHQGYAEVPVVGPLFFLNVIGSSSVVLLLLARRPLAFAGGALSISGGAIVSILISHTGSFFRFAEEGYSPQATAILAAEAAAVVLTLAGMAAARGRLLAPAPGVSAPSEATA